MILEMIKLDPNTNRMVTILKFKMYMPQISDTISFLLYNITVKHVYKHSKQEVI